MRAPTEWLEAEGQGLDALRALCEAEPAFAERYSGWREIGRGASSAVIATRLRMANMPVAVKILWGEARCLLAAEARALMQVTHPCVMRTYSVLEGRAVSWIEMELVEGTPLGSAMRARAGAPWPLAQALEIAACLAEGLVAVHEAGIAHRDLKPSNVLLPSNERPAAKLLDFGIARELDDTLELDGRLTGTPGYLSPEALRGVPAGREGDVYALCLILFELLSGQHPYGFGQHTTLAQMLDGHARAAPALLRRLVPDLPRRTADFIQRGLSKRPGQRPTALELAILLRAAQYDLDAEARPPRSRPRRALLTLLLVVTLASVALWVMG